MKAFTLRQIKDKGAIVAASAIQRRWGITPLKSSMIFIVPTNQK
ncbi:hypothetical protein [Flavobacterium akiainvivens]|nr:hypothetical protein [Flavobacterium akiainvivens]